MLGFDALGRLSLGQLPHTPALPKSIDPTNVPDGAQRHKQRDPGWQFYQQVGLPITPWNRLSPDYIEQAQTFKKRINDPQPMIVVGLPITPALLAPVAIDQPARRLRQEQVAGSVFVAPTVSVIYSLPAIDTKKRGDVYSSSIIVPLLGTPTPATLAGVYIEQAQKPSRRINDPQPQIVVGLPIKPAALTPSPLDQGYKFKYRINDQQPYLQVGLPITPAQLSPSAILEGFKRRVDLPTLSLTVSLGTSTPSVLTPVLLDQSLRFKYRINDPQPYLQVGLPVTPAPLTPVILEPHQQRRRLVDQQSYPSPLVSISLSWAFNFTDLRPIRRDQRDITLPLAQQFTQTPAALAPIVLDVLYRKIGLPEWTGNVNQPMPTATPSALAPAYLEQGLKFKYRVNDPQPYLQVGLPITPAPLAPVQIDQPLRATVRIADASPFPVARGTQPIVLRQSDDLTRPRRDHQGPGLLTQTFPLAAFVPSAALEIAVRRRAPNEYGISTVPVAAVSNTQRIPVWVDVPRRQHRAELTYGVVLRPTTQVVRLLLTRTLTGAGV